MMPFESHMLPWAKLRVSSCRHDGEGPHGFMLRKGQVLGNSCLEKHTALQKLEQRCGPDF